MHASQTPCMHGVRTYVPTYCMMLIYISKTISARKKQLSQFDQQLYNPIHTYIYIYKYICCLCTFRIGSVPFASARFRTVDLFAFELNHAPVLYVFLRSRSRVSRKPTRVYLLVKNSSPYLYVFICIEIDHFFDKQSPLRLVQQNFYKSYGYY